MRMFSGRLVSPLKMTAEDVRLDDICYALGNICRYGGHSHTHYSVAEHTCDVMDRVKLAGESDDIELFAGLHDAAEAYIGDIPSPIKDELRIPPIEMRIQKVIAEAFELNETDFQVSIDMGVVKRYDLEAGDFERAWLWTPDASRRTAQPRHWGARLHHRVSQLLIKRGMLQEKLTALGIFQA